MMVAKSQFRFHGYIPTAGFTLPEVMVSAILLVGISLTSTSMMLRSQTSTRTSSLRDAVNARIAEDLEQLRQKSWTWACETEAACSGKGADADKPLNYGTARQVIDPDAPAPRNMYLAACGHRVINPTSSPNDASLATTNLPPPSLAVEMKNDLGLPNGPTTITWDQSRTTYLVENVYLKRTILASGNELHVNYYTDPITPIKVQQNSTIVPQAAGWCI